MKKVTPTWKISNRKASTAKLVHVQPDRKTITVGSARFDLYPLNDENLKTIKNAGWELGELMEITRSFYKDGKYVTEGTGQYFYNATRKLHDL